MTGPAVKSRARAKPVVKTVRIRAWVEPVVVKTVKIHAWAEPMVKIVKNHGDPPTSVSKTTKVHTT